MAALRRHLVASVPVPWVSADSPVAPQHQEVGTARPALLQQHIQRRAIHHFAAVSVRHTRLLRPFGQPRNALLAVPPPQFIKGGRHFLAAEIHFVGVEGVNDPETGLVPLRQAHRLFERPPRTVREVHADEDGL